jgi:hypothetical protein
LRVHDLPSVVAHFTALLPGTRHKHYSQKQESATAFAAPPVAPLDAALSVVIRLLLGNIGAHLRAQIFGSASQPLLPHLVVILFGLLHQKTPIPAHVRNTVHQAADDRTPP